MIEFIKKLLIKLFHRNEVSVPIISEKEKTIRRDIYKRTDMGHTFSQTLEDILVHLMEQNYEDVVSEIGEHYIYCSVGGDKYKIWNGNYPYGWLNGVYKNSREIFEKKKPNIETMIQFKLWIEAGLDRTKEMNDLQKKIDCPVWHNTIEDYFFLKNNNHYSHHTVKSYIEEILELNNKCGETMEEKELENVIEPHVKQLFDITNKAISELQKFLKEQKEKEELELKRAKEAYKSAVLESSELLKARYSEYTKDFKLEG